jgi:hypothetical protein
VVLFFRSLLGANILEGPVTKTFCGENAECSSERYKDEVTHSKTVIFIFTAAGTSNFTNVRGPYTVIAKTCEMKVN